MELTRYGITLNGELLGVDADYNGDDAQVCNSATVVLETSSDNVWLIDTEVLAQSVIDYPTPWWNSSYTSPQLPRGYEKKKKSELKVVEVTLTVTELS